VTSGRWAVGVTTIPRRRGDLLPRTLASLTAAGFGDPRLFVDGCSHEEAASYEREFGLRVTARNPRLNVTYNWLLALEELFIRGGEAAEFLALFQDDLLAVKNLRPYLEATCAGEKAYWNCYCEARNEPYCRQNGKAVRGWRAASQRGWGALGLVFTRQGAADLLSSRSLMERPIVRSAEDRGRHWKAVDGAVVTALKKAGYRELVHCPSLLLHTGELSAVDKRNSDGTEETFPAYRWAPSMAARTFPGEDFDALTLLKGDAVETTEATAPAPKAAGISQALAEVLAFFRPRPECRVASDDRSEVTVEWDGAGGRCRYHDTPQGVKMEWVAARARDPEAG
jgi:hypothetical protein